LSPPPRCRRRTPVDFYILSGYISLVRRPRHTGRRYIISSVRLATSSVTDWSASLFSTVGDRHFSGWPSNTGLSGGAPRFWRSFAPWWLPVLMNTIRAFCLAGRARPSMLGLMSAGRLPFNSFCFSSFNGSLAADQGTAQPEFRPWSVVERSASAEESAAKG